MANTRRSSRSKTYAEVVREPPAPTPQPTQPAPPISQEPPIPLQPVQAVAEEFETVPRLNRSRKTTNEPRPIIPVLEIDGYDDFKKYPGWRRSFLNTMRRIGFIYFEAIQTDEKGNFVNDPPSHDTDSKVLSFIVEATPTGIASTIVDREKTCRMAWVALQTEFKESDDGEILRLRSEIRAIKILQNEDAIKVLQRYDMLVKELRDRGYCMNAKDEKLDMINMIRDNPYFNTTRAYANLTKCTAASLRRAIKDTNRTQRQLQTVATINNTNNHTVKSPNSNLQSPGPTDARRKFNRQCNHYNLSRCRYGITGKQGGLCPYNHDYEIKKKFLAARRATKRDDPPRSSQGERPRKRLKDADPRVALAITNGDDGRIMLDTCSSQHFLLLEDFDQESLKKCHVQFEAFKGNEKENKVTITEKGKASVTIQDKNNRPYTFTFDAFVAKQRIISYKLLQSDLLNENMTLSIIDNPSQTELTLTHDTDESLLFQFTLYNINNTLCFNLSSDTSLIIQDDKLLEHRRMCHIYTPNISCGDCRHAKNTMLHGKSDFSGWKDAAPGVRWSIDTKEMGIVSYNGIRYVLRFYDHSSQMYFDYMCFSRSSLEILKHFKSFFKIMDFYGIQVKFIHADRGSESDNKIMNEFLETLNIQRTYSTTYHPRSNSPIERTWRTTLQRLRTTMLDMNIPSRYWTEIWTAIRYIDIRFTSSERPTSFMQKLIHCERPSLKHARVLGSDCSVWIPKSHPKRPKLIPSIRGILVGYASNSYAYRIMNTNTDEITESNNVRFNEVQRNRQHDNTTINEDLANLPMNEVAPHDFSNRQHDNTIRNEGTANLPVNEIVSQDPSNRQNDNTTTRKLAVMPIEKETQNITQCLKNDRKRWLPVLKTEYHGLKSRNVWEIVSVPNIPLLKLHKYLVLPATKYDIDGRKIKDKVRLVLRGDKFRQGIDYHESYSPTCRSESIRLLISISAARKHKLYQFDIEQAYVEAAFDTKIYSEYPPHWKDAFGEAPKDGTCLLVKKALYGGKQSGRCWYKEFLEKITGYGFIQSIYDACMFIHPSIMLIIYVDDALISCVSKDEYDKFCTYLNKSFTVSQIGPANEFLGVKIISSVAGFTYDHTSYIRNIKQPYSVQAPLPKQIYPDRMHKSDNKNYDAHNYQKRVGQLGWIAKNTRPDVSFAFSFLASYNQAPTNDQAHLLFHVESYLNRFNHYTLPYLYNDGTGTFKARLLAYTDSDFASDTNTRKSRTGYLVYLVINTRYYLLTWASKKQPLIAHSSAEAEYVAICDVYKELLYFQHVIQELENNQVLNFDSPLQTIILSDNEPAIKLITNEKSQHSRTKHIDLRVQTIKEAYQNDPNLHISHVSTRDNIADLLTKPLSGTHTQELNDIIFQL